MLHQLPTELLEVIYQSLPSSDLCAIAILYHRHLHCTSLQHLFIRTHVFDPTRCSITILSKKMLPDNDGPAIIRGLSIARYLPFTPKLLSCTLDSLSPQIFTDIENLRRFTEKFNSFEEIILDFQFYMDCRRDSEHPSSIRGDTVTPIRELLNLAIFKGPCQQVTLLNGLMLTGFTLLDGNPPWMIFHGRYPKMNNFLGTLVGIGNRFRPLDLIPSKHSKLRVLNIHSLSLFHSAVLLPWTLRLLTLPSIEVLSIRQVYLEGSEWGLLLPRIHLPNLKEFYVKDAHIHLGDITAFFTRHRSLVKVDFGLQGLFPETNVNHSSPPWLFLPNVISFGSGPDALAFFLSGRTALPKIQDIFVDISVATFVSINLSGVLTTVRHRIKGLNVALRIWLANGNRSDWMQPHSQQDGYMPPSFCDHVTTLDIIVSVANFLVHLREVDTFLDWVKRFKRVKCIVIRSHRGGPWKEVTMKRLAEGLMKEEFVPKVVSVQLNDEAKSLEEWARA